jgi:transposase
MLSLPRNTRIYVHLPPTDLRMSFDGLSGIVRSAFAADLLDGGWFLFLNKRRDRIKILYWDRDGLALWYKRLEAGTFEQLRALADDSTTRELDATQLALLLNGVRLDAARRKRFAQAG